MTTEERQTRLKAFIICLKCEVSGHLCDVNCPVQYEAGNMGEIIENLEAILKILEQDRVLDKIYVEIQKLRNCSCSCSDGIINEVEDIIDKYRESK